VQQLAALQTLVAEHPEWGDGVAAFMVNQWGAESGLPTCSAKAILPILQDGEGDPMRTVFSAQYNYVVIVDTMSQLVQVIPTGVTGDPAALAAIVDGLL
jgi:hypothetical protein